jgi:hypothetical protein
MDRAIPILQECANMEKQLLFKVVVKSSGHEYRIFTNGEIEGFPEDSWVFNYFDVVATAEAPQSAHLPSQPSPCRETEQSKELPHKHG